MIRWFLDAFFNLVLANPKQRQFVLLFHDGCLMFFNFFYYLLSYIRNFFGKIICLNACVDIQDDISDKFYFSGRNLRSSAPPAL